MRVKENLSLLGAGDVFNVFTLSKSSLSPYLYDKDELNYLYTLIKAYTREQPSKFDKLIEKDLKSILVISYKDYPLPGFATKHGVPIVNLAPLGVTRLTDLQPADVFSSFVYATLFANYVKNKPFKKELTDVVSLFYFNAMMAMYGKSSGLIGTFSTLTPKLRYLITLFVYDGMFGEKITSTFLRRLSGFLHVPEEDLDLKFDFSNVVEFLRAVNKNGIISISENSFSRDIIRIGGIYSIPMFEDLSRLFATLLSSTVKGNKLFSSYWRRRSKAIFEKMFFHGIRNLKNN